MPVFGPFDCARFKPSAFLALFLILVSFLPAVGQIMKTESLVVTTAAGKTVTYSVELALTPDERAVGLMNRKKLEAGKGMLFDFGEVRRARMWMHDTLIPLDMLFIDADGRIATIRENAEPMSDAIIDSKTEIRFVLEIAGGESAKAGITVGDRVSSPQIEGQ